MTIAINPVEELDREKLGRRSSKDQRKSSSSSPSKSNWKERVKADKDLHNGERDLWDPTPSTSYSLKPSPRTDSSSPKKPKKPRKGSTAGSVVPVDSFLLDVTSANSDAGQDGLRKKRGLMRQSSKDDGEIGRTKSRNLASIKLPPVADQQPTPSVKRKSNRQRRYSV